jgi:DNA-binding PadR family transcriptional regulator
VDRHKAAIAKTIEFNSDDVLQVEQGSLCPALHRLIERRWISVEEGMSENNRRAKFYCLTAEGRKQLKAETSKRDKTGGGDRANSPPRRVKSCFAKGLGLMETRVASKAKGPFLVILIVGTASTTSLSGF